MFICKLFYHIVLGFCYNFYQIFGGLNSIYVETGLNGLETGLNGFDANVIPMKRFHYL